MLVMIAGCAPDEAEAPRVRRVSLVGPVLTSNDETPSDVFSEEFVVDGDASWQRSDKKSIHIADGKLFFFGPARRRVSTWRSMDVAAGDVTHAVVRARAGNNAKFALEWKGRDDDGATIDGEVVLQLTRDEGWTERLIDLTSHDGWSGLVTQMGLRLINRQGHAEIDSVRLIRIGARQRLSMIDRDGGQRTTIGDVHRPARPLIPSRPLDVDVSRAEAGSRLRFAVGVPHDVAARAGAAAILRTGDADAWSVPRTAGWHEREIVLDRPNAAVRIELDAEHVDDHVFLTPPTLAPPRPDRRPNVLLVTIDTLRADHLPMYGDAVTRAPRLSGLADHGAVFADVTTAANVTTPSHATLLTSLYPKDHGVLDNTFSLPDEANSLAEILRAEGYATCAAIGSVVMTPVVTNIDQGFDAFFDTASHKRIADDVNAAVLPWIRRHAEVPWFVWVHYYDPHTPYDPEPGDLAPYYPDDPTSTEHDGLPFRNYRVPSDVDGVRDVGFFHAQYRAEITRADRAVGALLDGIEAIGAADRTLVAVTADHGESLGEHDIYFSHEGIYEETILVPWIVRGPGVPAGVRIEAPVETVDVAPTLLGLLGLPTTSAMRGVARRLDAGDARGADVRYFQHSRDLSIGARTRRVHGVLHLAEHRTGEHRREITPGTVELFDLTADRSRDVAPSRDKDREAIRAALESWSADRGGMTAARADLSEEQRRALKQLGYLDGDDG